LEFFTKAITGHRKLVAGVFAIAAVVCAVALLGVDVNYDLAAYLPEGTPSTIAVEVMGSEFTGAFQNARVMVRDVGVAEALRYKRELAAIDGVADVLWLDDVADITQPVEMADGGLVEQYYSNRNALFSLTISGDELEATDRIYGVIGEGNALSGEAVSRGAVRVTMNTETTNAMLILVPMILVILLVSTTSWLEPLLFFAAIGISVLINMGTNALFKEISFVTFAISPILQLAVSLDYAIFLLHAFEDYRKQTDDVAEAMRLAMKRAFSAVAASAATTLFGFIALIFMNFKLGADLGVILAKGIVFSFVSVMTFLPALTLCCYRLLDKTRHRKLLPEFKSVGKFMPKIRVPALIVVLAIIVPCFLAQGRSEFLYGFADLTQEGRVGRDADMIDSQFGALNPIVLLAPRGNAAREAELTQRCGALAHVTRVISYTGAVGQEIPEEFLGDEVASQFFSPNYSRIVLYTDAESEGDETFELVERLRGMAREVYGSGSGGDVHVIGTSATLYDMKDVVTRDNSVVNMIAIISILGVLIVTFRSAALPVILLMTIETAIWLNISIAYFTATPLCYIGYLVISTVQLGATVDYAILFTDHYRAHRRTEPKLRAARAAFDEAFTSILVSGLVLSLAGFTLGLTSTNPIVSDMGILLGRGTIFSMLLVVCFLPAALIILDKIIVKTTYRMKEQLEDN
jgi:predicted RND superfamily exporter protein